MDPIRYDAIEPNIGHVSVQGSLVEVSWRCPVSGREVGRSSASMSADPALSARVGASVKRSIVSETIYGAARFVTGLVGGVAGRVVGQAVYTAANDIDARLTAGVDYTNATREAAIVNAFEAVKDSFAWDEKRKRFVAR